ncbi:MAG: hypothetical protein GY789_20595 [Hyphomicrobiales bacterium]|nr:hypothetical protein [Hyphomicrobiales bacterium]MCP4999504.1 hypothetical protein [Hyphomicrobiales bacterium]
MRKPHAAATLTAGLTMLLACNAYAQEWSNYVNERFGASADVPAFGIIPSEPPAGGGGRSWKSADGQGEISVHGSFTDGNWDDYRERRAKHMINNGVELVHEAWDEDWFVLSDVKDGKIRYTRAVRSLLCDPPVAVHVFLAYPIGQKSQYDRIVTHMVRSLSAEPGVECGG